MAAITTATPVQASTLRKGPPDERGQDPGRAKLLWEQSDNQPFAKHAEE